MLREPAFAPLVIGPVADHEFDDIVRLKLIGNPRQIALDLARARSLDIDNAANARIDGADIDRPARLERHFVARIAKRTQQLDTTRLRKRLAARDTDMLHAVVGDRL